MSRGHDRRPAHGVSATFAYSGLAVHKIDPVHVGEFRSGKRMVAREVVAASVALRHLGVVLDKLVLLCRTGRVNIRRKVGDRKPGVGMIDSLNRRTRRECNSAVSTDVANYSRRSAHRARLSKSKT